MLVASSVAERVYSELKHRYPRGLAPSWRGCGRVTGAFIAFEGIDGAGLTTHSTIAAQVLDKLLSGSGYGAVYTKEPTLGPIGGLIRSVLRGKADGSLSRPEVLALLFAADRLYHMTGGVDRCGGVALCVSRGFTVVTDRYKYTSIAYQAGAGASEQWVEAVNSYAPPPHILVYIDVDPRVAYERVTSRGPAQLYERDVKTLSAMRDRFLKVIERIKEKGEVVIGESRIGAPWEAFIDSCHYPPGRYPVVVRFDTTRASVEEAALRISESLAGLLVELGLAEPL